MCCSSWLMSWVSVEVSWCGRDAMSWLVRFGFICNRYSPALLALRAAIPSNSKFLSDGLRWWSTQESAFPPCSSTTLPCDRSIVLRMEY